MILHFDPFQLDPDRAELHGPCGQVPLEPKAFGLLCLLAGNADRVISRDEIVEKLWGGRVITDAALSTAVRQVRRALGDDGTSQTFLRTLRGQGFRFVAPVTRALPARPAPEAARPPPGPGAPPMLAVMPFETAGRRPEPLAQMLPADLISGLSRLRWLRVIARESSFRLTPGGTTPQALGSLLGAGYILSGRLDPVGQRLSVVVDLVASQDGTVIWSDRFDCPRAALADLRGQVVAAVVAALDLRIPLAEAERARLKPVESLDAWEAYHLGLRHMYRFNRADNATAEALFTRAVGLDPGLSAAWASRSFIRHQAAIMGYAASRAEALRDMAQDADRAMDQDPLDPMANFAFGRARAQIGEAADGLPWLDRSIALAPSFARGHYARGQLLAFSGPDDAAAIADVDRSLDLSPLDPLLPVMRGLRGVALARAGRFAEAVDWAQLAARTSQGHFINMMVSVVVLGLAGRGDLAARWSAEVRALRPDATAQTLLVALPFSDPVFAEQIRRALGDAGFSA